MRANGWPTVLLLGLITMAASACAEPRASCTNVVVLTGFWPPTNEMLRQWSTHPEQNPQGWRGRNWRNLGYDVYAFFPEFPPDGDPTNDDIGEPGSVGSEDSDLRVDYQDASADFWRIMDTYEPRILITTSRGGAIGWELEAYEGGHTEWASDRFGDHHFPTPGTVDPRSIDAITTFKDGVRLPSKLPLNKLETELSGLNPRVAVQIDENTSGNYLSGFVGLHGLYYNHITPDNLAAGHIHVGRDVSNADATMMMEETLERVLLEHPHCNGADQGGAD